MYRARVSVPSLGLSFCARKSLSLIHRQKPASGSNYDRAYVRAHAARASVGRAPARATPKWGV